MLNDETLKALIEAIIYVAPEPVSLDVMLKALEGEERERVKAKLEELTVDFQQAQHGIQVRQVAAGYKFSSKAEHHEVLRKFVKSLKPPIRLSKPALETLAVIAYRQPVTLPEIDEIRGVDCGGVIHTLMEKKLVVTAGRKNVVGRPILYRTSRDFLVHFGLKDTSELPSLKEFEELAKRALGSEWTVAEAAPPPRDAPAAAETSPQNDAGTAESMPEGTPALAQETQQARSSELPVTGEAETASGLASFETPRHGDSEPCGNDFKR
jgi:segregation and condensation protein B